MRLNMNRKMLNLKQAVIMLLILLMVMGSVLAQDDTSLAEELPEHTALIVSLGTVNVRAEPNTEAEIVGQAFAGQDFTLLDQAMTDDELWYEIALADDESGWITASLVRLFVQWNPVVETFDGVEMVLVPAGCFLMGSEAGEEDELPVHLRCFDTPFWIDRYEVTNFQYESAGYWEGATRPRDSVSWFDAADYCAARDSRLPTEAEWEYAARSPENRIYPWGNEFDDANAVSSWQETARRTEAVGSHPGGMSWVGAHDMSGNLWEWTSTLYDEYPYDAEDGREDPDDDMGLRVVRGGSCCSYVIADIRAAYRFPIDPYMQDQNVGFRCARDVETGE